MCPYNVSVMRSLHLQLNPGYCFGKIRFVEEDGTHQPDFVRISDDMMEKKVSTNRWDPLQSYQKYCLKGERVIRQDC